MHNLISQTNKSVLIIAHSWPPDAFVGAVRPAKLAKHLARHGWKPIVITVQKKYYEKIDPAEADGPTEARVFRTRCLRHPRELYLWAKACFYKLAGRQREFQESVRRGDGSTSERNLGLRAAAKRLVLSVFYTPDEYWGWLPFAVARSVSIIRREPVQCIISTGPPFTCHLVGLVIKRIFGLPWVADFRDPWTWHEADCSNTSSVVSNSINARFERMVLRYADRVVCVTPAMTERYSKLYPTLPDSKWVTITNGFDAEEFRRLDNIPCAPKFTISYMGSFDFKRSPKPVLEAVGQMIREGLIDRERVSIRLIGPCRYALGLSVEEMIMETGLKGVVEIAGFLPRTEALRDMMSAHVLLLLGGAQRSTVAAKSYEYIGAGKPILAVAEEGSTATADLMRRIGIGVVVNPRDSAGIKRTLATWYAQFADGGNLSPVACVNGVQRDYEWQELGARYASLLDASIEMRNPSA